MTEASNEQEAPKDTLPGPEPKKGKGKGKKPEGKKPEAASAPAEKPEAAPEAPVKKKSDHAKAVEPDDVVKADEMFVLPMRQITDTDENSRQEPSNVVALGYRLVCDPDVVVVDTDDKDQPIKGSEKTASLLHMALSDDLEDVRRFVRLIDEYETVDRKVTPYADQSIVELAQDLENHGQIIPVMVKKKKKDGGYSLYDGGRRCTAMLYNIAKAVIAKADGDKSIKIPAATILAAELKAEGGIDVSFLINSSRKNLSPYNQGKIFHELKSSTNPHTKKPYTLKEISEKTKIPYGTVRNYEAIFRDREEVADQRTGETKMVGLTDAEREKVRNGEMTPTHAIRKALGEAQPKSDGAPRTTKPKPKTMKELQEKFDSLPEQGATNEALRRLLAWAMGLAKSQEDDKGYNKACKESDERIEFADSQDVRKNTKKKKKGKAA